ncbi:hypothetical protein [Hymenobacter psychrotolerans]|uniref:Uncharacterized protein n=1 Tax=Hymenobacter psychrotolerans DSM 18569 TaxID=1121959 RepID=A0A1M6YFH9_9BACT|nr:hypothetical protein [Hymenobacter psychrotolerans]SHL17071.1 hypothetical protein SAMN02746009_02238 [Hymenobacter psychrotolerans DSM 18569]
MRLVSAWILFCWLCLNAPQAWACQVCRPRVQAAIHAPGYTANLGLLLLPVGVLLLVGLGVFFASDIRQRLPRASSHDD